VTGMTGSLPRRPAREALVIAMIGDPGRGLPDIAEVDFEQFWARFDAAAPLHVAVGLEAATVMIARVLPRLMGHRCGLARLDADAADAVVQRAARLPALGPLTEVAKVVACFAYFSDPGVQRAVRAVR